MRRIRKSSILDELRHRFPPTVLYRTDIDHIIEMANERDLNVKISDEDYGYTSLDEVQEQRGNRVYKLNIVAQKDNSIFETLDVLIEKDGVTLRCQKKDHLVPLWYEIKEFISKRMPWYARFMYPSRWVWAAIVWLLIRPKAEEFHTLPQSMVLVWQGVFALFVLVSIFSAYYRQMNHGIYLQKQYEVLGFWERNGDKMLMLIIGTVLGVIGTVVSNLITGKCL